MIIFCGKTTRKKILSKKEKVLFRFEVKKWKKSSPNEVVKSNVECESSAGTLQ